jgi:hypothetical protein
MELPEVCRTLVRTNHEITRIRIWTTSCLFVIRSCHFVVRALCPGDLNHSAVERPVSQLEQLHNRIPFKTHTSSPHLPIPHQS